MTSIRWTQRARADLAAIRAFIASDSPPYADVTVGRILGATDRLADHPQSGRRVPEFGRANLRELIVPPYRIVYRLVEGDEAHIVTVHHSARRLPPAL